MRVLDGLEALPEEPRGRPVTSVGFFDGMHRGHRQLFYELRVWAEAVGGEPAVVTFRRHPLEVLEGIEVPSIMTLEHRLVELGRHGVETVLLLDFRAIRDLDAGEFLRRVVRDGLGSRHLLLGFDSHLGRGRGGTPATLPALGEALGIEVRVASAVHDREGRKIGSSTIRDAIRRGDLETAANVLGHPFTVRGRVVAGTGRGRKLGVATANLDVGGQVLPPDGVYLVRVFRGGVTAAGLANLGVRPTFGSGGRRGLEVHVPGWSGEDTYGEVLEVRLVRRLRDERRFPDAGALRAQIDDDLAALAQAVERGEV